MKVLEVLNIIPLEEYVDVYVKGIGWYMNMSHEDILDKWGNYNVSKIEADMDDETEEYPIINMYLDVN